MSLFVKIIVTGLLVFLVGGFLYGYNQRGANETATIGKSEFVLEVANTEKKRIQGLSDRHDLKSGSGLLFVYDQPSEECIWMKNMNFSIDILWLNKDKKVVKAMQSVSPKTYPKSFCAGGTSYVIELNDGDIRSSGVQVGQQIAF